MFQELLLVFQLAGFRVPLGAVNSNLVCYSFFARIPSMSPSPGHHRTSSIHHVHLLAKMEILTKDRELLVNTLCQASIYGVF